MNVLATWLRCIRCRPILDRTCSATIMIAALSGCSSFVSTVTAPTDDYLAYRRVRTSRTAEERLHASSEYMTHHPRGEWRREVKPWFDEAEARYFASRRENPAGLATYLEILPDGPHSAEARRALALVRTRAQAAAKERLAFKARYTEERLAALAQQREATVFAFGTWIGRAMAIRSWTERTSALDSDFIFAWRIEKPRGRCDDDRCSKMVQLPYQLPGGGDDADRVMVIEIALKLVDGGVDEISIGGPALFSRLFEAATTKRVAVDDVAARIRAIEFAIEFVGGSIEARVPAASCSFEPVAPVVLLRSCSGWTVKLVAAEQLTDDDLVVIRGPAR